MQPQQQRRLRACGGGCGAATRCAAWHAPPPPRRIRAAAAAPVHRRNGGSAAPSGWEAPAAAGAPFELPPVRIAVDAADAARLIRAHILRAGPGAAPLALGFDTEAKPTFAAGATRRTALVQLATPRAVVLLHLAHLPPLPLLGEALHGAFICGVGVGSDVVDLAAASGARALDVAIAAARAGLAPPGGGLAATVAALGGPAMAKPRKLQMSNWEAAPLSASQKTYAAMDAFAGGWAAARIAAAGSVPFAEWAAGEADAQAREAAERAARKAAAVAALAAAAAAAGTTGGTWQELVARAAALLPDDDGFSVAYLRGLLSRLVKKGELLALGPPRAEGDASPGEQRYAARRPK